MRGELSFKPWFGGGSAHEIVPGLWCALPVFCFSVKLYRKLRGISSTRLLLCVKTDRTYAVCGVRTQMRLDPEQAAAMM